MAKASSGDLISMLEPYFTKQAPFQIPAKWRENLVNWIPWINLVVGILLLPVALVALGFAGFVSVVATSVGFADGPLVLISGLFLIASIALLFITFPGLKARKLSAWKLVFWADIVYFVYGIINSVGTGMIFNIVMQLLSTAIGLYVLFQIKSYYK
jgi:hypothetical protein